MSWVCGPPRSSTLIVFCAPLVAEPDLLLTFMTDMCFLCFGGFFPDLRCPSRQWMTRGHSYEEQAAWNTKYYALADSQMGLLNAEEEAVRAQCDVCVCLVLRPNGVGASGLSLAQRHAGRALDVSLKGRPVGRRFCSAVFAAL